MMLPAPESHHRPGRNIIPGEDLLAASHGLRGGPFGADGAADTADAAYPMPRILSALMVRMTRTWPRPPYHG